MLYIVATPIGNLEDITLRALKILKEVDFILCEDTRVTKKLLDHYGIQKPLISYHQHSRLQKIEFILKLLKEGKNLALVSDAGTPGISDPGNKLISYLVNQAIREERTKLPNYPSTQVPIVPIPGPSALTAALSISGFPTDKFLFLGFPPHKKGRQKFFQEIINSKYPVVFYESPHRIIRSLRHLYRLTQIPPRETQINTDIRVNQCDNLRKSAFLLERQVVVCRELTKKFETIYRGRIDEVIKKIEKNKIKGEFVIVVSPC
jgi:16S rRNA (cytidine1402-2'-O)-methyltransferase